MTATQSPTGEASWRDVMARHRRVIRWPGDAMVAVTIGVALEAFENQCQVRLAGAPGERDSFSLSYGEYGTRVGVWRLLELFDEFGVLASFSVSGQVAEQWPEVVRAVSDAGHDLVGHGWQNDLFLREASEASERDIIRRTLDAIEDASNGRPGGWASPANSSTERTPEILAQEGVRWYGDDASDDLPFVRSVPSGRIAVLPKANLASNDLMQWIWPTNGPDVFETGFIDTLTTGLNEGRRGAPQWADMVLHCHMAGRPAFVPTLRRCLERALAHEGVWWATKDAMADWALAENFER